MPLQGRRSRSQDLHLLAPQLVRALPGPQVEVALLNRVEVALPLQAQESLLREVELILVTGFTRASALPKGHVALQLVLQANRQLEV